MAAKSTPDDGVAGEEAEEAVMLRAAKMSQGKRESSTGDRKRNNVIYANICTANCGHEADPKMIECKKCRKYTHFSCTQLPTYQLAQFMVKNYSKYVCANCFGNVDEYYLVNNDEPIYAEVENKSDNQTKTTRIEVEVQTEPMADNADSENTIMKYGLGLAEAQIQKMEREIQELKEKNNNINTKLGESECELERVNECLSEERNRNVDIDILKNESHKLKDDHRILISKYDKLKDANDELKERNDNLNEKLGVSECELERVNNCLTEEKNRNAVLKQNLNDIKTENFILEKKITASNAEYENVENRLKTQGNIIAKLQKENDENKEKAVTFSKDTTEKEYKTLESKLSAAQALIAGRNDQVEKLRVNILHLEASLKKQEENEKQLQSLLNTRESDLVEQQKKFDEAGSPDFDNLISIENTVKKQIETIVGSRDEIRANNEQMELKITQALNQNAFQMEQELDELTSQDKSSTHSPDVSPTVVKPTYAGLFCIPEVVKKAIHDERIEKKQEESDIDRRKKNFIIHNADEEGENNEEINKQDLGFVKEIFDKLGITSQPKMVTRLGEAKENRKRPLKVVMKSPDDQIKVMKNLGLLKNTEDQFGKISVREDHTQSEREEINALVKKAKEKSNNDNERIWKVRGDPRSKNGLRLVSFIRNR